MILAAEISSAVGIKGEVRLFSHLENPEILTQLSEVDTDKNKTLKILSLSSKSGKKYVCRIDGISDRNTAELLKGTKLYIPDSELPEAEEGLFYFNDLIGMECYKTGGELVGKVCGVYNFGASDIIEIELESGEKPMYALTDETFPTIDIKTRRITVNIPEEI